MGVRIKAYATTASDEKDPIYVDTTQEQRETTVDGYTFHWGPNEVRNFLDDGVGAAHAAQTNPGTNVVEDTKAYGDSRS